MNRRDFLKASAIVTATAALEGCAAVSPTPTPTTLPTTLPSVSGAQQILNDLQNLDNLYAIALAVGGPLLPAPDYAAAVAVQTVAVAALAAAQSAINNGLSVLTIQQFVTAAEDAVNELKAHPATAAAVSMALAKPEIAAEVKKAGLAKVK
jgi:hypothetical protein